MDAQISPSQTLSHAAGRASRVPLAGLLGAILISVTGNAVAAVAIPWYVLETTGSPAKTGLAAFFNLVPQVLGAFFGGTIADRLGHKRAGVLADLLSGLSVALIPLLHATLGLPFWVLLALVFGGALFDAGGLTARTALLMGLAKRAGVRLERVNALEEVAFGLPLLLGPPVAGLLIAWTDASRVLWLDAASFAVSASLVAVLVPSRVRPPVEETGRSFREDLAEGVRFVARDRLMLRLVLFFGAIEMLVTAVSAVLMPVYMRQTYGSSVRLGFLIALVGIGSLTGIAAYGLLGHRLPRRHVLVAGALGLGIAALVFSFLPPFWVLVVLALAGGATYGPFSPLVSTVVGERTPEEVRGRVFGVLTAVTSAVPPFGVLAVGVGLQALGVRPIMVVTSLCFLGLALAIAMSRSLGGLTAQQPSDKGN
jgi:MFS family permease